MYIITALMFISIAVIGIISVITVKLYHKDQQMNEAEKELLEFIAEVKQKYNE